MRSKLPIVSQVFTPLLNENFEIRELENMNEVVRRQHSLFREKVRVVYYKYFIATVLKLQIFIQVRTEKSLQAIKRKRDDDVFDEFEFSIEDLR